MKKEQTLLLVAAGVAALLVWQSTGLYQPVQAAQVPSGEKVEVRATAPADPLKGCDAPVPGPRNLWLEQRTVGFDEFPELSLPVPPALVVPYIRPLPWPALPAETWSLLRDPMTPVSRPEKPAPEEEAAAEPEEEDPEAVAAREAEEERKRQAEATEARRIRSAKLVHRDGDEQPCRLTPAGADQGQPVWVILEKWPQVEFWVEELSKKDYLTPVGKYPVKPSENERVLTVHLEQTLENEYHEERIRRGVAEPTRPGARPGDRAAHVEFAQWIRAQLGPRYGIPAVRMALQHLDVAKALQADLALVLQIGETCQEAYDLDREIASYLDYLQGARASETAVIVRLGDAYERAGALHAARDQFDKAATLGDAEARLRLAAVMLRLADGPAELEAAYAEHAKAQSAGQKEQRARALAGMARVRLRQGNLAQALQHATEARAAEPASLEAQMVLGVAQYASGKFADAEKSFTAAEALEQGSTRAKSNRAMARLALDRLPEAVADAEACLAADPLNYLDPLVVQGQALQRWGDLTAGNDAFQTALQREPRNAWVLLRLAAIRLRDGLPAEALEILRGADGRGGLLDLAPGSVDALHVAGLACAAQDPPLWDDAVKYLRRALQKDPSNVDLIYDLGRILYQAGRTEDALAFLEAATESNAGLAKNDARVLALLAYVYFDGPHLVTEATQTFARVRQAVPPPWTRQWVDDAQAAVTRWYNTRVWRDDFERVQGRVMNGWDDAAKVLGVNISCADSTCLMKGSQTAAAPDRSKYTGIVRTEQLASFQESTVTLRAGPGFEFVVHLWAGELPPAGAGEPGAGGGRGGRRGTWAELGIGRDRNGRMMLYTFSGGAALFEVPVKDAEGADRMWPADGAFHSVTFQRVGAGPAELSKGRFRILVDGEEVPTPSPVEVGTLSAASKPASFGVHVDADLGGTVDLAIDSVEIKRVLKR